MVARAVVRLVDDQPTLQTVQAEAMKSELLDKLERFQQYGFTGVPFPGAEAVLVFACGNREHGLITNIDDRRYRPVELAAGEVCLYTDEDGKSGEHRIHFKRGQVIEARSGSNCSVVMDPNQITLTVGSSSIVMADSGITITCSSFDLNEA